ncbi:homoserine dehydrogenase [Candidatus Woesearchaeota archaeon]|nr:homoserine dehydrogenase [Candidatus Woesearchaeota archaeon]
MEETPTINIGLLGFGTVGQGVYRYLQELYDSEKTGYNINIARILVRDLNRPRTVDVNPALLTTNPDDVLKYRLGGKPLDVIVEVMGGINPAGVLMLEALKSGIHVVTANKAFLTYGNSQKHKLSDKEIKRMHEQNEWPKDYNSMPLFVTTFSQNVNLGFEAAVAGEIPIIEHLFRLPSTKEILGLEGIVNGTCNFILTQMERGMSYNQALKLAQEKGLAEADPSFDVDGIDASQKLALLSSMLLGTKINLSDIQCEGITKVTKSDIECANTFGYKIKHLAVVRRHSDGSIELRVGPELVKRETTFATIANESNAVALYLKERENPEIFIGNGAGAIPTASAIVSDIVEVYRTPSESRSPIYNIFTGYPEKVRLHDPKTQWYLRLQANPGVERVLRNTVLRNQFSSGVRILKGPGDLGAAFPLDHVFITSESTEAQINDVLNDPRLAPYKVIPRLKLRIKKEI